MKRGAMVALLLASGLVVSADEPPAIASPAIEIPPVDVEANVRRILEEARTRQVRPEGSTEPVPAAADTNREALEATRQEVLPRHASPTGPDAGSDYVPMPDMTITVRSVRDVDTVAQELEAATRKKASDSSTAPKKP